MDMQCVSLSTTCSLDTGYPFLHHQHQQLDVYRMDCPASSKSGTGMNKNADAGTSPVPE